MHRNAVFVAVVIGALILLTVVLYWDNDDHGPVRAPAIALTATKPVVHVITASPKILRSIVRSPPVARGLANQGNSCYMAAMLQALRDVHYLDETKLERDICDEYACRDRGVLTSVMPFLTDRERGLDRGDFLQIESAVGVRQSGSQQDAAEFLMKFVDVVTLRYSDDTRTLVETVEKSWSELDAELKRAGQPVSPRLGVHVVALCAELSEDNASPQTAAFSTQAADHSTRFENGSLMIAGIVVHSGGDKVVTNYSGGWGHYVYLRRTETGWDLFDDAHVTALTVRDAASYLDSRRIYAMVCSGVKDD